MINVEEYPRDFHCGGSGDMVKDQSALLFPKTKLGDVLSGMADIARSSYKKERPGWG